MKVTIRGAFVLAAALALTWPAAAEETPKRGGTLTYLIPADAPPSFDGHREATFATVHATAPFYSVLIRINPENPSSTSDFVCYLCTEMPRPTDDGKTYTFKIRDGVKFHDGSPLTAVDVAASWQRIVSPPAGVTSARQAFYTMVDRSNRRTRAQSCSGSNSPRPPSFRRSPIHSRISTRKPLWTRIRTGTKRTF